MSSRVGTGLQVPATQRVAASNAASPQTLIILCVHTGRAAHADNQGLQLICTMHLLQGSFVHPAVCYASPQMDNIPIPSSRCRSRSLPVILGHIIPDKFARVVQANLNVEDILISVSEASKQPVPALTWNENSLRGRLLMPKPLTSPIRTWQNSPQGTLIASTPGHRQHRTEFQSRLD